MSEYQEDARSGWLASFFGGRGQAVLGTLLMLFTVGVFGVVARDAYISNFKDKSGVKRIIAKRWNERTLVFPIEGTDRAGRRATIALRRHRAVARSAR